MRRVECIHPASAACIPCDPRWTTTAYVPPGPAPGLQHFRFLHSDSNPKMHAGHAASETRCQVGALFDKSPTQAQGRGLLIPAKKGVTAGASAIATRKQYFSAAARRWLSTSSNHQNVPSIMISPSPAIRLLNLRMLNLIPNPNFVIVRRRQCAPTWCAAIRVSKGKVNPWKLLVLQ